MLHLLPLDQLQASESGPDLACLAKLRFAVSDQNRCVELITDHKFSKEIVHALNLLGKQQKRQETGVREFSKFCVEEFARFKADGSYQEAYSRGLQTTARLALAAEWLGSDLEGVGEQEAALQMLRSLRGCKTDVGKLVAELGTLYQSSEGQLGQVVQEAGGEAITFNPGLIADLVKEAKALPELRKVDMFGRCQAILQRSEAMARKTGVAARHSLHRLHSSLASIWSLTSGDQQLSQVYQCM
jgi:hypothetical protein